MQYAAFVFIASVVAAGAVYGFARGFMRSRDAEAWARARLAYDQGKAAEADERRQLAGRQLVDRYFPFAKVAFEKATGSGGVGERLLQALGAISGVVLGTASIGFPAVLAFQERLKHLLILGRTGGGKTTILLRLLAADLSRGVAVFVLGSESEFFRDWGLGLVPEDRIGDVIYFRPADPRCGLVWNPLAIPAGVDRAVAAGQLFTAIKRALGEAEIGARADAILASALAIMIPRADASLLTLTRFLEDDAYRATVVEQADDPYLRSFWQGTAAEFPAGSTLPIVTRLNRFLRVPPVRAATCGPFSTVSLHDALANARVVYFDVGGLDPETAKLLSMLALAALQIELFRRDAIREEERSFVAVYIDEMHFFADSAEGTWRELLARGRRHGLGLVLASQHIGQLPRSLQREVSSCCSSLIVAGGVSAADATGLRKELVVPSDSGDLVPVPAEDLVAARVGEGLARLGTGACCLRVTFAPPLPKPAESRGQRVQQLSWRNFAAPPSRIKSEPIPTQSGNLPKELPTVGRGGAKHRLLQGLVREWGEARGFRVGVEEDVLDGAGRVDVTLTRGGIRIAVEVAVTSTAEQLAASVTRVFAAGFSQAVVLFGDDAIRRVNETTVAERLDAKDRERTRFVDADGIRAYLDEIVDASGTAPTPAGYRLIVRQERVSQVVLAGRRKVLAQLVGVALLRDRSQA